MRDSRHCEFIDTIATESRYSRQSLLEWWDQEKLSNARVVVVGAGAIGNEVLKNLALLGVGKILIIDFDTVELSNLSRTVLFREHDIGKSKASSAALAVRELNSDIEVDYIHGDVELDLGLGELREFNAVLGCLDNVNARWAINRACMRTGVPWINAGMNATSGEVSLYTADSSCFECSMSDAMWARFHERHSCMLLFRTIPKGAVPTTAILSSLTAALQVNELVSLIQGTHHALVAGQKFFLSTKPLHSFIVELPRNPDCPAHECFPETERIDFAPHDITVSALLEMFGAQSLELEYDLLKQLECPNCGPTDVFQPLKKFRQTNLECEKCAVMRTPIVTHEIKGDQNSFRTLADIGVPFRGILRLKKDNCSIYCELTKTRGN